MATRTRSARSANFRAHVRRSAHLRALVTHVQRGWQRPVDIVDVSLGGACLVVAEPIAVGDIVTLAFTAPTLWDPLVLRATVAWASGGRAGVAFDHRGAAGLFALFELVNTTSYE